MKWLSQMLEHKKDERTQIRQETIAKQVADINAIVREFEKKSTAKNDDRSQRQNNTR